MWIVWRRGGRVWNVWGRVYSASVEEDGAKYGMDCMKEGRREGVSGVCGGEEGGL